MATRLTVVRQPLKWWDQKLLATGIATNGSCLNGFPFWEQNPNEQGYSGGFAGFFNPPHADNSNTDIIQEQCRESNFVMLTSIELKGMVSYVSDDLTGEMNNGNIVKIFVIRRKNWNGGNYTGMGLPSEGHFTNPSSLDLLGPSCFIKGTDYGPISEILWETVITVPPPKMAYKGPVFPITLGGIKIPFEAKIPVNQVVRFWRRTGSDPTDIGCQLADDSYTIAAWASFEDLNGPYLSVNCRCRYFDLREGE